MEQLSLLDLSLEQAIMQHYQDFLFNDDKENVGSNLKREFSLLVV